MTYLRASRDREQPRQPTAVARNGITEGLTAAWNPGVGYGLWDASRHRNNAATVVGTPLRTAGPSGTAAYSYSATAEWTAGSGTPALGADGFSIAMWINFVATPVNYGTMLGRVGTTGAGGTDWEIDTFGAAARPIYARNGGILFDSNTATGLNAWNLWVVTVDSAGAGVWYRNAVSVNTGSSIPIRAATGAILINNRASTNRNNAALGDIAIWGRPLGAAEVRALAVDYWRIIYEQRTLTYFIPEVVAPGGTTIPIFHHHYQSMRAA